MPIMVTVTAATVRPAFTIPLLSLVPTKNRIGQQQDKSCACPITSQNTSFLIRKYYVFREVEGKLPPEYRVGAKHLEPARVSSNEPIVANRKVIAGSNRSFGIVFAAAFAIYALWPLVSGGEPRLWAGGVAAAFALAAFARPQLLTPLNRLWFRFGLVLHHMVNPIVMGLIFFAAVVPVGVVMRMLGKDLLRLRRDPKPKATGSRASRRVREPGSMTRQF